MDGPSNLDNAIYFDEKTIPMITISTDPTDVEEAKYSHAGETMPSEFVEDWTTQTGGRKVWTRKIASWNDPLTPPQTRTKCVKMCRVGPIKSCCGWKTQTRHLRNEATLIVQLKTAQDIKQDINDCMVTGAVAAAITAIISYGSGAIAAGEKAFLLCLEVKLGEDLVNVKIKIKSRWGGWG